MKSDKPKEFWILGFATGKRQVSDSKPNANGDHYFRQDDGLSFPLQSVDHVIEYSAYEKAEEEIKRLKDALENISERMEAGLAGMYGHQDVSPQQHCYEMQEEFINVAKQALENEEKNDCS